MIECVVELIVRRINRDGHIQDCDEVSFRKLESLIIDHTKPMWNGKFDSNPYLSFDSRRRLIDGTIIFSFDIFFGVLFGSKADNESRYKSFECITNILAHISSSDDILTQKYSVLALWSFLANLSVTTSYDTERKQNHNGSIENSFEHFSKEYPNIKQNSADTDMDHKCDVCNQQYLKCMENKKFIMKTEPVDVNQLVSQSCFSEMLKKYGRF